jgi:hypothetical protein
LGINNPEVRRALQHWQQDANLAELRSEPVLSKLTKAERQQWQQLWLEVETLGRRAAESRSDGN